MGSVPPGLGWEAITEPPGLSGWGASITKDAGLLAAKDPIASFAPSLDPIAVKSPIHESSDPPVERPKSAAGIGAVSRPRSSSGTNAASAGGLTPDVLPNGMPALPADLSLDVPVNLQPDARSQIFGGSAHHSVAAAAFPGVLFSLPGQQTSSSMWQQFSQPQAAAAALPQQGGVSQAAQDQAAYNLSAAKQAFYNAGGDQPFTTPLSSMSNSASQFGAFAGAQPGQGGQPSLQFGQLQTAFGAPFVPTGNEGSLLLTTIVMCR
jgi:hypothetical protein